MIFKAGIVIFKDPEILLGKIRLRRTQYAVPVDMKFCKNSDCMHFSSHSENRNITTYLRITVLYLTYLQKYSYKVSISEEFT
jgi:hypothetical protein